MTPTRDSDPDAVVEALGALFLEHPAWREAASLVSDESTSDVYFTHRPGGAWQLARREGQSVLTPGTCESPDLVFRFAPGSVERLRDVAGGVGVFAVELFSLIDSDDPNIRIDFRVAAPFSVLVQHGYLRLLIAAGPRVAAYGARRGIFSPRGLKRVVEASLQRGPFEWERAS